MSPENYKLFNDAVHGCVTLHPLCVKIIDTPQFQRLRFLKQLGNTYYVFPSASHNRFEHCIGVCYLAGRFVRELKEKLDDDLDRKEYSETGLTQDCRITPQDILCVEIAGLCHDLGHGPFSHMWEAFMHRCCPESEFTHENLSLQMFDHLIKENNLKEEFEKEGLKEHDIEFIKLLIKGTPLEDSQSLKICGRGKEKTFLCEIVSNSSNGIDVDKCDYLLRDGHSLGIKVMFDPLRLQKFSRVVHVEGRNIICIRDKEDDNVISMLNCRHVLHRHAYQHRVVTAVDLMVTDALCKANKRLITRGKTDGLTLEECSGDMVAYTSLTDDILLRILNSDDTSVEMQAAKKIISDIMHRRFYKCIGEVLIDQKDNAIKSTKILDEMSSHLPDSLPQHEIAIKKINLHFGMQDDNPLRHVYFYNKRNPNIAFKKNFDPTCRILPTNYQEVRYRVYCRKNNKVDLSNALTALKKACIKLKLPEPNSNIEDTNNNFYISSNQGID